MADINAFFNHGTGITNYRDDHGANMGMDMPDQMGGTYHTNGIGMITHHSQPDHIGGIQVRDAHGQLTASIHHDALGNDHYTSPQGQELMSSRPNVFHGQNLFLPDGQYLGGTHDMGDGHTQFQADPLVGMGSIRFPHFA